MEDKLIGTGRTTRLIDKYIQDLFEKGVILVRDHHDDSNSHKRLTQRILNRLFYEELISPEHVMTFNGSTQIEIKKDFLNHYGITKE